MKIAIQGHFTKGKEIIQILESLGGKTIFAGLGFDERYYYYINSNSIIERSLITIKTKDEFKLYTLEEFEQEFPFKVGDKITFMGLDYPEVITKMTWMDNEIFYNFGDKSWYNTKALKKLKMKEERNITLTLDKAKEWYNKGGELKEIALQAFTEKELNPLPRSWEEYCRKYEYTCLSTRYTNIPLKYDALFKLEQLRDCYRGLFVTVIGMPVWNISMYDGKPHIFQAMWGKNQSFLSFQSKEVAEKYLKNFKPLIEKAGDLIS